MSREPKYSKDRLWKYYQKQWKKSRRIQKEKNSDPSKTQSSLVTLNPFSMIILGIQNLGGIYNANNLISNNDNEHPDLASPLAISLHRWPPAPIMTAVLFFNEKKLFKYWLSITKLIHYYSL